MSPTITAAIVPWGEVKAGEVVLSRGEIVTVREMWPTWEKGVGIVVLIPACPERAAHEEHREEHVDSLTAVLSRAGVST